MPDSRLFDPQRTYHTRVPDDVIARQEAPGAGAGPASRRGEAINSLTIFPPWIYPPYNGVDFFQSGQQTVTGPTTIVTLTNPDIQLPPNSVGVIREISVFVNNLLTTSDITFTLLFAGRPVAGFDNIFVFPRAAASVTSTFGPQSTILRVPDATHIQMRVNVVDAGSYQLGASVKGWFYSKALAEQYGTL